MKIIDRLKNHEYPGIVFYLLLIGGAFLAGVVIFDLIVMPGLVGKRDTVAVPAIEGMSAKQAEEVCRAEHLELVVAASRNSDEVPEGYVITQDPQQGRGLKRGRSVKAVVSSGRRMEIVPSFTGKTLREAEVLIAGAGLVKGRVVRIFVEAAEQPSVLATSPSAGAKVPRGATVDILVAMAGEPKSYLMPSLVGRDFPFVKDALARLGFDVVHSVKKGASGRFPNAIISQSPAPGSKIREGDTIELVVSTLE